MLLFVGGEYAESARVTAMLVWVPREVCLRSVNI